MIISKAIELLDLISKDPLSICAPDTPDALKLGIEALKRLQDVRLHPFHPVYSPLPGESMPERGIQAGMQKTKKTPSK